MLVSILFTKNNTRCTRACFLHTDFAFEELRLSRTTRSPLRSVPGPTTSSHKIPIRIASLLLSEGTRVTASALFVLTIKDRQDGKWTQFTGDQLGALFASTVLAKYKAAGKPIGLSYFSTP